MAENRVKIKENEMKDKFLDFARWVKKAREHDSGGIRVVISGLGTIPNDFIRGLDEMEIGESTETIQNTALVRITTILRRVLGTWGDFLSLTLQWNAIS